MRSKELAQIGRQRLEIGRLGGERHKDQILDHANLRPLQSQLRLVLVRRQLPGSQERPVLVEAPGMIGADQLGGMAGLGQADAGSAVRADVEQRVDGPVLGANDDDRFAGQIRGRSRPPWGGIRLACPTKFQWRR